MERVKLLGHPSPKEGSKPHAGLGALGTTGAATDFAGNDQWTDTAFRKIIMRGNTRNRDKDKEFREKAFHTFA